jgi:hypothetical protein
MLPDWVEAYRSKGTTVKQRGDSYYLYLATSRRVPGKRHPVSQQTYLGRITPEGVVRDRVSIKVSSTEARRLGEVREGVPPRVRRHRRAQRKGRLAPDEGGQETGPQARRTRDRGGRKGGRLAARCHAVRTRDLRGPNLTTLSGMRDPSFGVMGPGVMGPGAGTPRGSLSTYAWRRIA